MVRTRRITADIDSKNRYVLAFYTLRAIMYLKPQHLVIKKSARKGYHLFVWTKEDGKKDKLRSMIGDDKRRIRLDKTRKIAKQTLFNTKERYK